MTRRLAFVGVLLALLVSASSANSAGVSAPSPIYLRTEGLKQVGRLAESNWTERRGRYCVGQNGLGTYQFPHGLTVGAGDHRGRFRLPVADRPRKVVLRTWTQADAQRYPVGDPKRIPHDLEPQRRHGRTRAWLVHFTGSVADHLYIDLYAVWDGDCGQRDWIEWRYHLRAGSHG